MSSAAPQLPGNVAMFDMAVAMNWIKDYISFFGGNPNNIVTMGQGTGASSAMMMGLSPMTQGERGKKWGRGGGFVLLDPRLT